MALSSRLDAKTKHLPLTEGELATARRAHLLALFLCVVAGVAFALIPYSEASFLPLPETDELDVPAPEGDTAFEKLGNLLGPIGRNLRIIVGGIAVLLIVVSGFTMVVAGDNEETVKTQRKSLVWGLLGLLMISIAGPIAEIFDFRSGGLISDPDALVERAGLFDDTTRIVITFLKYLLGGLATLMAVRSGAVMVMQGHNEEDITREKKTLVLSASGLLLVMFSELAVRRVFYVTSFDEDAEATEVALAQNEFVQQLVGLTNLMVTFVGPIMMLGLVIGGFLYVTAGGDEERTGLAKKILLNSIIGVVIIYGAFALVSTIISGQF